jgi:hypothetical protein
MTESNRIRVVQSSNVGASSFSTPTVSFAAAGGIMTPLFHKLHRGPSKASPYQAIGAVHNPNPTVSALKSGFTDSGIIVTYVCHHRTYGESRIYHEPNRSTSETRFFREGLCPV